VTEEQDSVVWHAPFELSGAKDCQYGIADCTIGRSVNIAPHIDKPGAFVVYLSENLLPIGIITAKNKMAKILSDGANILRAEVNSVGGPDANGMYPAPRIRVITGSEEAALTDERMNIKPRSYPVQIVGEQHYQAAIKSMHEGDGVTLWHEPNNPYDDEAIAVTRDDGETLGYIPRDSWLRRALLEEGKGCTATIHTAKAGARGFIELELLVVLDGEPIDER